MRLRTKRLRKLNAQLTERVVIGDKADFRYLMGGKPLQIGELIAKPAPGVRIQQRRIVVIRQPAAVVKHVQAG